MAQKANATAMTIWSTDVWMTDFRIGIPPASVAVLARPTVREFADKSDLELSCWDSSDRTILSTDECDAYWRPVSALSECTDSDHRTMDCDTVPGMRL